MQLNSIFLLTFLVIYSQCLQLRQTQHEMMTTTHYYATAFRFINISTILIIIVVAVILFFVIKCFCCMNTNTNTAVVVVRGENNQN